MKYLRVKLWLAVLLCGSASAYADATLYAPCAACHGAQAEGVQALSAPALAGQNAAYLQEQLENFKSGARGAHADDIQGQVMAATANNLSAADIRSLANFVAALPAKKHAPLSGNVERGKKLYQDNCLACHGVNGEGVTPLYSANLRMLSAWYLERQLDAYRNGWRGNSTQGTTRAKGMRAIVSQLKDESEIKDVIAFLTNE